MAGISQFDIRLDPKIKKKAEKAAALLGIPSLSEFVERLVDEHSSRIIAGNETLTVPEDVFDRFMAACEAISPPNQALREAVDLARAKGVK